MKRTTLRRARQRAGLTQDQLAKLAGRDQALISKLERGEHTNPTNDTIEALAKALGIAPSTLRFSSPEPSPTVRERADKAGHRETVGARS